MERIQKILSARGVCSRRQAEEWILQGRITCNGKTCALGDQADVENDEILVDGNPLPSAVNYIYIMLHKPRGFVTTMSDEKGRKDVTQLLTDCKHRVYPIGRLDMDSEGLLLFTNDGELANVLMHPKHQVDKVYKVSVDNYCVEGLRRLEESVLIDGYRIKKPQVRLLQENGNRATILVTIHEGRNRQVRKMCALAGMQVRRLVRIQEGALCLGQLPVGKWRYLTNDEVALLKK